MKTRRNDILALTIIMTVMLIQSCTLSYPPLYYYDGYDEDTNTEVGSRVAIRPTINRQTIAFQVKATRGGGAFDAEQYSSTFERRYLDMNFHVLSFRRTAMQQGELSSYADYRTLMNSSNNTNRKDCLVSTEKASVSSSDYRGKPTMLISTDGALFFLDESAAEQSVKDIYWNETYQDIGYDFFTYYIEDAKINSVNAQEDKVTYNMTIDGTQDLMFGTAPEVTEGLLESKFTSIDNKEKVVSLGDGGYTTYGASLGVQPAFDLEHALARVQFKARPVSSSAENITVTKVSIITNNNIEFTVAARDKSELGVKTVGDTQTEISVCDTAYIDEDDALVFPDTFTPIELDIRKSSAWKNLGGSLLFAPTENLRVKLYYDQQVHVSSDPDRADEMMTLKGIYEDTLGSDAFGGKYEAGTTYIVKFDIHGFQQVEANVTVQGWIDGGSVDITPQE